MVSQKPKISVIIPCYNEAEIILQTLDTVANFFNSHDWEFEIIVVDDASGDNTSQRAGEREYSWVKVFRNNVNRGKGYSIKRGVAESNGEMILFCDADMSTPIDEVLKLEKYIDEYDIVIASRAINGAQVERCQPFYKVLAGKLGNLWIRLVLGLNFQDTQCGFKLIRGDVAREIGKDLKIEGFCFDYSLYFFKLLHNTPTR